MGEQFSVSFLLKLVDQLSNPLTKVGDAFDKLDKKYSAASKSGMEMGKKMTAWITLPIMGWATYAAHTSGEINKAFREMGDSLEDLPADKLGDLKKQLLDLSTHVPRSAEELAEYARMAGQMNKLGDVAGFTKFMSAFTEANKDMGSKEAISNFLDMAETLKLTQAEYQHTGDIITMLKDKFHTTAGAIVDGTIDLSHLKMTTKVTNDELMALSAWTDTIGSTGGMAMKQFTRVMSDAAQAKEMLNLAIMTKVVGKGTNTAEFMKEFEKSPARMIQKFLQGMAGMKDNGQIYEMLKIMDKLGLSGNRIQGFFLRGAGAAENLGRILDAINDKQAVNNRMTKEAEESYGDFGNQMKMLWEAVRGFAKQFGDDIKPVMKWLVNTAKTIVEMFTHLPAPLRYGIEALMGLAAALGPLLIGMSMFKGALAVIPALGPALASVVPAATALATALAPVAAVIATGAGAYALGGWMNKKINAGMEWFTGESGATLGGKLYDWTHSGAGGALGAKGEATIRVELGPGLKNAGVQSRGSVLPEVNTDGYAGLRFAH